MIIKDEKVLHPGKVLERLMETEHISKEEMASAIGLSKSKLERLMRGASQFTPEISEIIDRYIGTKPGFWHDLERAYESSHSSDLDDVTERYTQEHALGEAITRTVLSPSQVLRILQERAGMTQSELANALGITPSLLSRIMRDKVKITPEIAEEINKVFHVPVKFWDKAAENYKQSIREQWINRYSVDP